MHSTGIQEIIGSVIAWDLDPSYSLFKNISFKTARLPFIFFLLEYLESDKRDIQQSGSINSVLLIVLQTK